jgi:hypothetical protein
LARALTPVVAKYPERFVADIDGFRSLDATYVRALLTGLRDAIKEQRAVDWAPVLDLCGWIVRQPREIPGRDKEQVRDREVDPDWGWTRQTCAQLISAGLEEGPESIPTDLRANTWEVIMELTDDPEPTPEYEERYGGTNMDPFTISINTVRGDAMHAVFNYALWVYRSLKDQPGPDEALACGFENMPEVEAILEKHLNPSFEPSLAIRSVYGQTFPWLVMLDKEWTRQRVPEIFPPQDANKALHDAAWNAYIVFCRPYDNVFELLVNEYATAVEHLGIVKEKLVRPADPDERLVEHLMVLYWRGKLPLDEPEGLISKLFRIGSNEIRGHALVFVGLSLLNTKEEVPIEVLDRLQSLWENRIAAAKEDNEGTDFRAEMSSFGWWFASSKFDPKWSLARLSDALLISGKVDVDDHVVEKLAMLIDDFPLEVVQCLELIVKGDKEGWGIYGWNENAKLVLSKALTTEASENAESLIHFLGTRGYREFGSLLRK